MAAAQKNSTEWQAKGRCPRCRVRSQKTAALAFPPGPTAVASAMQAAEGCHSIADRGGCPMGIVVPKTRWRDRQGGCRQRAGGA